MSKDTTKQHITDCFNGLSRKYTLDQITVNMIAEAAGVSKSTFYRHFLDKYDVMNYNYKRVLDEIFSFNACKSWNELFLSILSFIEKDINRIRHAFFISRDELLRAVRFRVFVQTYEREMRRKTRKRVARRRDIHGKTHNLRLRIRRKRLGFRR